MRSKARFAVMAMTVGVLACAAPGRRAGAALRDTAAGYAVEVVVNGVAAPTYQHRGETFVLGTLGERYVLRVHNRTARRVEAVVTVDGRDVIDGKTGDVRKRGYLVGPWGFVDIDGWRVSSHHAAAFRFSSVPQSYAARTGSPRNVGVIGVALFPEARPVIPRPLYRPAPRRDSVPEMEQQGAGPAGDAAGAAESRSSAAPAPAARGEAAAESAPMDGAEGAQATRRSRERTQRPGLGTEFGEEVHSRVHEVPFSRASSTSPSVVLGVRYDDRAGLYAIGIDVDLPFVGMGESDLRRTAEPFPVNHRRYASPPPGWRAR